MTWLDRFHPTVAGWFADNFAAPTAVQEQGWEAIAGGSHTLVSAPTGSGKTLTAFLAGIDSLIRRAEAGTLADAIDIIYVSPLKALSADIYRNLQTPLAQMQAHNPAASQIRVAIRTGDTTAAERSAILRSVPHILVTTPESLYLLLTASRSRRLLGSVRTVIVDELHALMRDKRGSHLALSLARLDALCATPPVRIGLSATVSPLEEAAAFLCGRNAGGDSRPCRIVDAGHRRDLELSLCVPGSELGAVASNEQWEETYDQLADLVRAHHTTLVFVNTRRMAERVAHNLEQRLGADWVGAHHGSLSKERRLNLEQRLKEGRIRAIVATASLELGIDIGYVELVCQIGTPRAITTFLQRIGRAGHALGKISKGRLFATTRDELLECTALLRAVAEGTLDRIEPPQAPLDVLAQQIVAECACREWDESELLALIRTAEPYAQLGAEAYGEVVEMLSEGPAARLGRGRALLHRDRIGGLLRGRRAARLTAITNGGAIPEVADYRVLLDPDDTFLGTVNEDWAVESMAGDVFLLGSHSWRIVRVESRRGVLRVEDAAGQPPSVPFWLGEAPGRTWELSAAVSGLRTEIAARPQSDAVAWLMAATGIERAAAEQMTAYVGAQKAAIGLVPSQEEVVFERFFDESGGMQLVVHAPFGSRVNRGLGLALRKRFCVNFDFELQAAATDDAVILSLGPQHSFPLEDAFTFVRSHQVEATLRQAVLPTPLFTTRWRQDVTRSLMVSRNSGGKKVPFPLQRMRSDDLLAAVFPAQVACQENVSGPIEIPDHPLVNQTMHDCLYEAMDLPRLQNILRRIEAGEIHLHARETTEPSPFAHEILNAKPYAFLDDAPLEERRAQAVNLRRVLPENQRDLGQLDAQAIARVCEEAWPAPRDAQELQETLMQLLVARPAEPWQEWFAELCNRGLAGTFALADGTAFWFAAENLAAVRALYGDVGIVPQLNVPAELLRNVDHDGAVENAVRGQMEVSGPLTAAQLAQRLCLSLAEVRSALARLEGEGLVLAGSFNAVGGEIQYCDRRLLARIHRLTLDRLRKEIEPVTAQDFMRYLLHRQGLTAGARREGKRGIVEVVAQLQGFEIPAIAWEREILPRRIAGYNPRWLDELCLEGEVTWARLSLREFDSEKRSAATRATPISLVLRRDLPWMLQAVRGGQAAAVPASGASAAVYAALQEQGALFLDDLVHASRRLPGEVDAALWDLVSRGLVHGDGFGALRQIMRPDRHRLGGRGRGPLAPGRWSPLRSLRAELSADELAEKVAQQLLLRYGVVFRDLIAREQWSLPWRDIVRALRRMEARGSVRGGRFVSGFIGEQYALIDAVGALRRMRNTARDGDAVQVNGSDPLNLQGIIHPGPRTPARHTTEVRFVDGLLQPL